MPHNIKKVTREVLLRDFNNVERVHVETDTESYNRLLFVTKDAVAILVKHVEENKFFFVSQARACKIEEVDPTVLEVPAGMLNKDENLEEAAARECFEETGYLPKKLEYNGWAWSAPGIMTEKMHYFYAEVTQDDKKGAGGGLDEESEFIDVIALSEEQVRSRLKNGEFEDAKTLVLIQQYFLFNKL